MTTIEKLEARIAALESRFSREKIEIVAGSRVAIITEAIDAVHYSRYKNLVGIAFDHASGDKEWIGVEWPNGRKYGYLKSSLVALDVLATAPPPPPEPKPKRTAWPIGQKFRVKTDRCEIVYILAKMDIGRTNLIIIEDSRPHPRKTLGWKKAKDIKYKCAIGQNEYVALPADFLSEAEPIKD